MSCSVCNRAGHDEEMHGDEGVEILELRESLLALRRALEGVLEVCRDRKAFVLQGLRAFARAEQIAHYERGLENAS